MKIKNHWLQADSSEAIRLRPTKNARELIDPDYLVVHYTATDSATEALNWFLSIPPANPDRIAAHVIIDTDGSITQLVPFNQRANHAGPSTWNNTDSLNYHAIGIELVNPGFVSKLSDGSFVRKITEKHSKTYPASRTDEIARASHKHRFWNEQYWFKFPAEQIAALKRLSSALIAHYQLVQVVGHDDISPARKPDPGPAFPWDEFRKELGLGINTGKIFTVNTAGTNLRTDPSTSHPEIKKLPVGYQVGLIDNHGMWSKVYLAEKVSEVLQKQGKVMRSVKTIGWIHSSLLDPKP